jgi:hypothetical protein
MPSRDSFRRALPVHQDLAAAEDNPFLDELKSPGIEAVGQHVSVGWY